MENKQPVQYAKIGVLSAAHALNDFYSNYLPQLLPFLVILIPGFTATQAAVLVSAFTITSSFAQPLIGLYLDRHGKRWFVYVGTLWMAVLLSLTGIVTSYAALVAIAAAAGLGTALFHPQAASMVNQMSGNKKGVVLSAFVACGNVGFALSPLLLVPVFQTFGLAASLYTAIPGIIITVLLLMFTPRSQPDTTEVPSLKEVFTSLKSSARELLAVMGVIAVRSLAFTGMLTMLPLYFKSENISNLNASYLLTILLISGAFGGLLGGFLSDRFGRKRLIVLSLIAATPLFFAFLYTQGIWSTIFLGFAGAALFANFSVTIVAAQEAIPANKALAAGLTMGFAGGLGALAVIWIGNIADAFGLGAAISVLFCLPVLAGLAGLFMKSRPPEHSERKN